ncbi:MAG: class I SAM-dependent methyltransferase [bacterium]|nr:class I SAM-dependent methyltransferase [bacterium]
MISPIEYNAAWSKTCLRSPEIWYTWRILESYVKKAEKRLEIGAGMFPKFSVQGTYFLDTSLHAINELNKRGGKGVVKGAEEQLPFQKDFFDLIGAFEVLEHLKRPGRAIREVAKTIKPGGLFILSVPMNPQYWSPWDVFAGHVQRFEPAQLNALLEKEGFEVRHCYVVWKLAKKRVFSWFMRLAGSLPLHFPFFFFFLYNYAVIPYTWFGRTFSKSRHYSSLLGIPQDSTCALVVCAKR